MPISRKQLKLVGYGLLGALLIADGCWYLTRNGHYSAEDAVEISSAKRLPDRIAFEDMRF
jgi:hypothetical protein